MSAGEGGLRAAGDREDGEEADREHRGELDHRLEGDGGDHAVMALVLVEGAGAEEDGEEREAGRGPEGDDGVLLGAAAGDGLVAQGERLQLQRDVGGGAATAPMVAMRGERPGLAVARRDHVGDRGDPVGAADPHHLAHQPPPADEDQRRPEVDGHELEPGRAAEPTAP